MTEENTTQTPAETSATSTDAPAKEGLLGNITPTTEQKEQTGQTGQTGQSGESTDPRPEWLPEKFKTPEDFAKSYGELEKKIGSQEKAPDSYDYTKVTEYGLDTFTEDQQKQATDVFKHYGLSQRQAEGMLSLYGDAMKTAVEQVKADYEAQYPAPDLAQENESLKRTWGTEYTNNMASVKNFTQNLPKEILQYPITESAEGVKLLYDVMTAAQGPNPIQGNYGTSQNSIAGIRERINELRNSDNYRLPQGDAVGDSTRAEIYRLYQQLDRIGK